MRLEKTAGIFIVFHRFHSLEATMSSWVSNAPPGAVDDDRATTPLDIPQARLDKQVNDDKP